MKPKIIQWLEEEFNPDCYLDPKDLEKDKGRIRWNKAVIDEEFGGGTAEVLIAYCRFKQRAMRLRFSGNIAEALMHERSCEILYAQIPQQIQW